MLLQNIELKKFAINFFMETDVGQQIMDKLDELDIVLSKTHNKVLKKVEGKKNSCPHIMINTEEKNKLMQKAKDKEVHLSEWCRRKLKEDDQLNRIEMKIDKLLK